MVGAVSSRTPNYGFAIIRYDSVGWHSNEHDNWKLVDALLAAAGNIPGVRGPWQNAVTYLVGDRVVDTTDNTIWRCSVANTSSASGNFPTERAAHPTYWAQVTSVPEYRGAWTTGVNYNTTDIVSVGNAWYICIAIHTSGVFATDLANGLWTLMVNMQPSIDAAAGYASAASGSATAAAGSASAASTSASAAAGSASAASGSASAAASSASAASGSATAASTSATNASNSATTAAGHSSAANTSASNAANSATSANTSASQAGNSETNAAASAAAAAASAATIANDKVQVGAIEFYATGTAPGNRMKANGAVVAVASFGALLAAIYCGDANNPTAAWGYRTNSTDTVRSTTGTHIKLPDGRGEFIRAFDDARGVDVGRTLWSTQAQMFEQHIHELTGYAPAGSFAQTGASIALSNVGNTNTSGPKTGTFGTETRPRNLAFLMTIKVA